MYVGYTLCLDVFQVAFANNSLSVHPNYMKFRNGIVQKVFVYIFHIKYEMQIWGDFTYALLGLKIPCPTYALLALG